MCAFGGKKSQNFLVAITSHLLLVDRVAIETLKKNFSRSQSNDGKKGKKRTAATETSSGRTNHKVASDKVASEKVATAVAARATKTSKANTKSSTNLKSNDDNNGAGSLSIGSGPPAVHTSTNNSTHTTSTTTAATSQTVKLSPAPSSTGSARTSSPVVNVTIMKKYRDEPSTSRTPDMPSFGGVPTAGGLKFGYEQQQPAGLVVNTVWLPNESGVAEPSVKSVPTGSSTAISGAVHLPAVLAL